MWFRLMFDSEHEELRKSNLLNLLLLLQFQPFGAASCGNQSRRFRRRACSTWCPALSARNTDPSLCNRALYFVSRAAGGELRL